MTVHAEKRHAFTGHSGAVYALCKGFREGQILSGSSDRMVAGWDVAQLEQDNFAAKFPDPVYSLAAAGSRLLLAGSGTGNLHLVDVDKKEELKILQLHTAPVFDIAVAATHGLVFTAGADGQLGVVRLDDFSPVTVRRLCAEKVRGMAVSPDEAQLAVACGDGRIRIFALPSLETVHEFAAHDLSANSVCWHPQGRYLLSGGRDAFLKAWDPQHFFAPVTSIPAHNYAIYAITFSPGAQWFATGSRDKTVKIWDAENISFQLRIDSAHHEGHVNSVNRLCWIKEGLCSAGDDRSILVWRIFS